jgi:isochorismate hydrolase
LEALIQTFKTAARGLTSDADRTFMQDVWLERLIRAAEQQGAKIPNR